MGWLSNRLPLLTWAGFLTRCPPVGVSLRCGSKEARAPVDPESDMPAVVVPIIRRSRRASWRCFGVDPHKGSHTAVAIDEAVRELGEVQVRASVGQLERLLRWAAGFERRTWAVEGAGGMGYLLAQQLVAVGERVVDVPPKLSARVRVLASGKSNKNDPNDARSVAVAALQSRSLKEARVEDHVAVMRVWAKRNNDLGRARNRTACRLHSVLCELVPGGIANEISAAQAADLLDRIEPADAVEGARHELALELVADLRRSTSRCASRRSGSRTRWRRRARR